LIQIIPQNTHVKYAHFLDEPVEDNTPILMPTPVIKLKLNDRVKQRLNSLGNKIKSELNTFADSLVEYITSAVR